MKDLNNKIIKQYFENKFNQENNYKAILSKVRKEEKMGKNKIIKMCATFVLTIGVAADRKSTRLNSSHL